MESLAIYLNCILHITGAQEMRDWEPEHKRKTFVDRMFEQMYAATPKRGYNVVRIDPWHIQNNDIADNDALTVLGHFNTYQEAVQALGKYSNKHIVTIYGPRQQSRGKKQEDQ